MPTDLGPEWDALDIWEPFDPRVGQRVLVRLSGECGPQGQ